MIPWKPVKAGLYIFLHCFFLPLQHQMRTNSFQYFTSKEAHDLPVPLRKPFLLAFVTNTKYHGSRNSTCRYDIRQLESLANVSVKNQTAVSPRTCKTYFPFILSFSACSSSGFGFAPDLLRFGFSRAIDGPDRNLPNKRLRKVSKGE
ncbi:hypothetical protein SCA6_005374 [Theobroma cacao]